MEASGTDGLYDFIEHDQATRVRRCVGQDNGLQTLSRRLMLRPSTAIAFVGEPTGK
jgi:hypothetical protein